MPTTQQWGPQLVDALLKLSPDELNKLDHATLYRARDYAPKELQNVLAGPEHRAFAREATRNDPTMALPIAIGALAYQPYKMLTGKARSDAGMNQTMEGLAGVKDGLGQFVGDKVKALENMLIDLQTPPDPGNGKI